MPDGVGFKMLTEPTQRFIADRQVRMRKAAMFTIRAGGRIVKKEAQARAPVLKGRGVTTHAQYRRGVKFRKAGGIGPVQGSAGPVAGLLRASIAPSKKLQVVGLEQWQLKVGPRGPRVHLYAAKQEKRTGFMKAGNDKVQAEMVAISAAAYGRVWREG